MAIFNFLSINEGEFSRGRKKEVQIGLVLSHACARGLTYDKATLKHAE